MRFTTNSPNLVCSRLSYLFLKKTNSMNTAIYVVASLVMVICILVTRTTISDELIDSLSSTVESGYYSDESTTWYIDTQVGLSSGYWIYLAAQKNNEGSEYGFDLDSRSYFVGFGSDPEEEWSYDLTYENWGNPGDIDTDALRSTIIWTSGNWALSIMPQYREIDLAGIENEDSFSFNERGLGAGAQYMGFEGWIFYLERYEYRFSKDPDFLEDIRVTDRLTLTGTSLAQGLYDHETVLGIGSWIDSVYIGIQRTQSKSAIDNALVQTSEVQVDYHFSDEVLPYLRIGRTSSPGLSALWFGNIGLQFGW
jgi:hypothetical protein